MEVLKVRGEVVTVRGGGSQGKGEIVKVRGGVVKVRGESSQGKGWK